MANIFVLITGRACCETVGAHKKSDTKTCKPNIVIIVFRHRNFFYYYLIIFIFNMNEKFQADSDCGSFPFSNDKYKNN